MRMYWGVPEILTVHDACSHTGTACGALQPVPSRHTEAEIPHVFVLLVGAQASH